MPADVFAVVHTVETDLCGGLVGFVKRRGERIASCRDAQHAPAARDDGVALSARSRVQHLHIRDLPRLSEALNSLAVFKLPRIPPGCQHYASTGALLPFQLCGLQSLRRNVSKHLGQVK